MTAGEDFDLLRTMLLIRWCEQAIAGMVERGEAKTPCHLCIGQEAVAAGMCAALGPADTVWGNHRSHGHYLARTGDLRGLLAEVLCRATGCSGGRGGSMHLLASAHGILGTVPIVGGTVPLAAGAALAALRRGTGGLAVACFGDGALEEGHVIETMNLAVTYALPIIFLCENNLYASHLHLSQRRRQPELSALGTACGLTVSVVDGNDVQAMRDAAAMAVAQARGGRPVMLEARTFRWLGHVGHREDLDVGVCRRDDLAAWRARCPILRERQRLVRQGASLEALDRLSAAVAAEVDQALAWARSQPAPDVGTLLDHVYPATAGVP